MAYVADLHTHSPFTRGTSRQLTFANLAKWARLKGIDLLATGDFTHPTWFQETQKSLRDTGTGPLEFDGVHFVLGTEVNCVGEVAGRSRRVHVLVLAPTIGTVEAINSALASKGALASDGRPTLHLAPKELLSTLLEIDERCMLIPAHLWTPWFGLYGSKSGFDSLEECFEDLTEHVHAIETGMSSDPAMNWRVSSLDDVSIVSFSDAHSLPNLGRELTAFEGELSYDGLVESLRSQRIAYTVEFFPEEGKYHHSGHRKCGVRLSPGEVQAKGTACAVCGRPLTLGVMQRVEELADREVKVRTDEDGLVRADNGRPPFKSLVPLQQILSEGLGYGPSTKKVQTAYTDLVSRFGSELAVLIEVGPSEIAEVCGERVAASVARVRKGKITIDPGYDGVYGQVRIWGEA